MKYLKKFNELKSSTYKNAVKKLQGLGHKRRAAVMTDYITDVEEKERLKKIKENREKYSQSGIFKASIVFDKWEGKGDDRYLTYKSPLSERNLEGEMIGNFHLALWFDDDIYYDRLCEYVGGDNDIWLNFTLGIVAADDETEKWFNSEEYGVRKWDFYFSGIYSPNRPFVKLTNSVGNFDPQPMGNENWENDKFLFEGRSEAIKFKKFMIDLFEGRLELEVYDNIVTEVKKSIANLPTFDKTQAIKRILSEKLPNNKFGDNEIKDMIVRYGKYTNSLEKLIDSSGGDWVREDVTDELVNKIKDEISNTIDEMTEEQYKIFVEKSIKQLKINQFYR